MELAGGVLRTGLSSAATSVYAEFLPSYLRGADGRQVQPLLCQSLARTTERLRRKQRRTTPESAEL